MLMMWLWSQHLVNDDDMALVPTPCADNVNVVEVTTLCVVDDDVVSTFLC